MQGDAMIYWAILTAKTAAEVTAISHPIEERISRFVEDYPDREHTFVSPWPERPEVYVAAARSRQDLTPEVARRLGLCRSVLLFEGPGNPWECADQVSVLKLYLEALKGSVIDWGDIDYGWPLIQTSEDALASLGALPDEPRLLSDELEDG
jgi:hypothetical protein